MGEEVEDDHLLVDVELHGPHCASGVQRFGEHVERELVPARIEHMSLSVDADGGAPGREGASDAAPQPTHVVPEPGHDRAAVDDQMEVLPHLGDIGTELRVSPPHRDSCAAVGVHDERRDPVLKGARRVTLFERAAWGVAHLVAGVERGEKLALQIDGHLRARGP